MSDIFTEYPLFAYLRRSTKKKEQEDSLPQQEEGLVSMSKMLGFSLDSVNKFIESRSGFENKTRPEWKKMLKEIDGLKKPCIIFVRDTSRLSRNPKDNLALADRIYGDNKQKKRIHKIFYLGEKSWIQEWSDNTDKKTIVDALHTNYTNSLDTKSKSATGIMLSLEGGYFPRNPPKGLKRVGEKKKKILAQTEMMPFVKRAFEMKAEGCTHKEISQYLKTFGIKIGERSLTENIFSKTIYIGRYYDSGSQRHFDNLKFDEGKPPIPFSLWQKVQLRLGKKASQYGAKQDGHILKSKIKSESGHLFSRYLVKGRFWYYKWKNKDPITGKEKFINVSEEKILTQFVMELGRVVLSLAKKHRISFWEDIERKALGSLWSSRINPDSIDFDDLGVPLDGSGDDSDLSYVHSRLMREDSSLRVSDGPVSEIRKAISLQLQQRETLQWPEGLLAESGKQYLMAQNWFSYEGLAAFLMEKFSEAQKDGNTASLNREEFIHEYLHDVWERVLFEEGVTYSAPSDIAPSTAVLSDELETSREMVSVAEAAKALSDALRREYEENNRSLIDMRKRRIAELVSEKNKAIEDKDIYRMNAILRGLSIEEIDRTSQRLDNRVRGIDETISEIRQQTEMEKIFDNLPTVFSKTIELINNLYDKGRTGNELIDIVPLIKLTTIELIITTKKSLIVRLSPVIEGLVSMDKSLLEAPSGVEPLSKALQASV